MPPKVEKIVFDDRGRVVLPAGSPAPSEETLLARAHLLQGQEARRDSDKLLTSSIATPEELKAFVGGRTLTPADILGAKVAQASAAQLREGVAQTAADQVAATAQASADQVKAAKKTSAAINNLRQESEAANKLAKVTAERLSQLQIDAIINGSASITKQVAVADTQARKAALEAADVATKLQTAVAASAGGAAAAPASVAAPTPATPAPAPADPTASASPAPADPTAPAPVLPKIYIQEVRNKLAAHNRNFTTDRRVTDGIAAYDQLTASGFWHNKMATEAKRGNITPRAQGLLLKVQEGVEASGITVKKDSALRKYLDGLRAGLIDMIQAPPSTPVGPIAAPLPSVPTTPPGTPVPAPQTGSGLVASATAWRAAATSALDLADAGDQVGALRMLAQHAREIPEVKMSAIHTYILGTQSNLK